MIAFVIVFMLFWAIILTMVGCLMASKGNIAGILIAFLGSAIIGLIIAMVMYDTHSKDQVNQNQNNNYNQGYNPNNGYQMNNGVSPSNPNNQVYTATSQQDFVKSNYDDNCSCVCVQKYLQDQLRLVASKTETTESTSEAA